MKAAKTIIQKGYTLIELLLYLSLIGILLTGLTTYFGTVLDARVKNQTISEVNQQGTILMDYMTQIIRNADSITTPTAGQGGESLVITVPAGASPVTFSNDGTGGTGGTANLGFDQIGNTTDSSNANTINATGIVSGVGGTITTLRAYVNSVESSPGNKGQMAVYRGATGPTTLLANSVTTVLTSDAWNTFTIPQITITAGDKLWLAYNTNALGASGNNLEYRAGVAGQSLTLAQSYGSWPASWVGTGRAVEFSAYAIVNTTANIGAAQIKEGAAGSQVPLTNGKVLVSNLNFTNVTRPGTPGAVQISFTIYRPNPLNRNEYDYQKTFVGTAALR